MSFGAFSQQTITLQPDAQCGKDSFVWFANGAQYDNENSNYGDGQTLLAHSWTNGGEEDRSRLLIDFDLSSIPAGATINSASLSIYNDPVSSTNNGEHSNLSGSNASIIRRITSPWNEMQVTWNTQPSVTIQNEVDRAQTTDVHEDFVDMDVTALVSDMVTFPNDAFGFELSLVTEDPYRMLVMASSDHPDPSKHPKLVVTFTPEEETSACLQLRIDSGCGEDTFVWYSADDGYDNEITNYSESQSMLVHAWTTNGLADQGATLLQWDLSGIPENAAITSAAISLYNDPTSPSFEGEHQIQYGDFQWKIKLIDSPWDGSTVTWNNQPSSTEDGAIILNSPSGVNDDFTNVDVTSLVQQMVENPETYFGLKLQLSSDNPYQALVFATSEHPDQANHPLLKVCYTTETADNTQEVSAADFRMFPNPSSGEITISFGSQAVRGISIFDVSGKCVFSDITNEVVATYDLRSLEAGMYTVVIGNEISRSVEKLVLQPQ